MRRFVLRMILGFAGVVSLVFFPSSALAQGAIAGQVTDTSGGIVPGVTGKRAVPS